MLSRSELMRWRRQYPDLTMTWGRTELVLYPDKIPHANDVPEGFESPLDYQSYISPMRNAMADELENTASKIAVIKINTANTGEQAPEDRKHPDKADVKIPQQQMQRKTVPPSIQR